MGLKEHMRWRKTGDDYYEGFVGSAIGPVGKIWYVTTPFTGEGFYTVAVARMASDRSWSGTNEHPRSVTAAKRLAQKALATGMGFDGLPERSSRESRQRLDKILNEVKQELK